MADQEHLAILKRGSSAWNEWREENPQVVPDLGQAHLQQARLSGANLSGANLRLSYFGQADLSGADLRHADLSETSLRRAYLASARLDNASLAGADLRRADFYGAQMAKANLSGAFLEGANLTGANLEYARLAGADLRLALAVDVNLRHADLSGCQVHGISAWNVALDSADQRDLIITPPEEPPVTTDSLHVAQFLYLILNNRAIRDVIETVGKKAVLILGRFGAERKLVLEGVRNELRRAGLVPILFDFDGPVNRDITETVSTLAHLARAVIADITEARSIPQELMAIIPNLPSVPVQPIVAKTAETYGMFEHFQRYPWVRETYSYASPQALLDWLRSNLHEIVPG
jgi:Pentapeptide repeats (8 copies)